MCFTASSLRLAEDDSLLNWSNRNFTNKLYELLIELIIGVAVKLWFDVIYVELYTGFVVLYLVLCTDEVCNYCWSCWINIPAVRWRYLLNVKVK